MDDGITSVTSVGVSARQDRREASAWALAGAATALGAVIATAQHFFERALDTIPVEGRDPVILTAMQSIVEGMARGIWVVAILAGLVAITALVLSGRRGGARWLAIVGFALAMLAAFMQWRLEDFYRWA
jgi:hypothetical protein